MFSPDLKVALLNIPKCGSCTVRQCLRFHAERKKATLNGVPYELHLALSEIKESAQKDGFKIDDMQVIAIVRNPIDRFLSGLNYLFSDRYSHSLDKCVSLALKNNHNEEYLVFRPMSFFLDTDIKGLKLFPFEKITEAVRSFGYVGIVPHINKSRKRFLKEQLEPYMKDILSYYKDDIKIYNTVLAVKESEYELC